MKKKPELAASSLSEIPLAIPKDSDISLLIKTMDNVWVRVSIDGKVIFQNELRKNSSESWNAKERIDLKIGKPEAVQLYINKESILLPKLSQNIVITKNSLKINPK